MHSGWPDRDRLLRKKWEGIEMMSIKSLYEISEITVWRKGMIVFSWRSPSSPSSELSGKNGEDKVTGKRDGVIRELKKHEHGKLVKSYKPCSRSTRSWTFAYRRCMTNDVKLSDFAFYGGLEHKIAVCLFFFFAEARYISLEFNGRKVRQYRDNLNDMNCNKVSDEVWNIANSFRYHKMWRAN